MILLFTMLHEQKGLKSFSFKPTTLESGLDFISYLCKEGDEVISAHLIEDGSVTELSVDSFDGSPFSAPIRKLTKQWKALLAVPLPQPSLPEDTSPSPTHINFIQEQIELIVHQVELTESRMQNVALILNRIEQLRDVELVKSKQKFSLLYQRYQMQTTLFKNQLDRLTSRHAQLLQRLNRLAYL